MDTNEDLQSLIHNSNKSKEEIIKEINDDLGRDELDFISLRYTNQVTLEGYTNQITLEESNVPEISLTNAGREFVKKHRFEIRAPFSVHTFVQEMKKREKEIEKTLREISVNLEDDNELEYTPEGIDGLMKRVEDYFDEIRNKRV